MRYVMIYLLLAGCSSVSFNKEINTDPSNFNKYGMQFERKLSGKDYSAKVTPSADLPTPNLILERGLIKGRIR